jgi:hypothetical protein
MDLPNRFVLRCNLDVVYSGVSAHGDHKERRWRYVLGACCVHK